MEEYNPKVHTDDYDFKGKTIQFTELYDLKCFCDNILQPLKERHYTYNKKNGLNYIETLTLFDAGVTGVLFRFVDFTVVLRSTDTLFPVIPDFNYSRGVYIDWTHLLIRFYSLRELSVKPAIKRDE